MEIKIYQVDAFTSKLFGGNPAAVCPLKEWLSNDDMQKIASENNLSETAFYVPKGDEFELKWFTPKAEVNLCGHATLATAFVIFDGGGASRSRQSTPRYADHRINRHRCRLQAVLLGRWRALP